jgi:hypothetical protein
MSRERRQSGPRLSDIERAVDKCAPSPRFRFVQDDSSHRYAIPAELRDQFDKWVASYEQDWNEYVPFDGPDFDQYRLNMRPSNYTFTDLKEDA